MPTPRTPVRAQQHVWTRATAGCILSCMPAASGESASASAWHLLRAPRAAHARAPHARAPCLWCAALLRTWGLTHAATVPRVPMQELIFGATDYTTAIDTWSFGCVFAGLPSSLRLPLPWRARTFWPPPSPTLGAAPLSRILSSLLSLLASAPRLHGMHLHQCEHSRVRWEMAMYWRWAGRGPCFSRACA